jgi:hypothetical protein
MPLYKGHLICTKSGTVRYTKGASTKPSEVAVSFNFELPDTLFWKPVIPLKVQVDPVKPPVITPELRVKAQELLEKEFGLKIELAIVAKDPCPECGLYRDGECDPEKDPCDERKTFMEVRG